ncbi:g3920 [Coccomyxa elongata]
MVYHPRRWWYIVPSVIAASALAGAMYNWEETTYGKYKPITLSPCWKLAEFERWWEWPREAADPVILNPLRHNIPGYIKNLHVVEEIEDEAQELAEHQLH